MAEVWSNTQQSLSVGYALVLLWTLFCMAPKAVVVPPLRVLFLR